MISRRNFLSVLTISAAAGCASIPPDITRRRHGVGDATLTPAEPWRPAPFESGNAPADPPGEADAKTVYVCPMHPEISQSTPGVCPRCSMALVRAKSGGEK